MESLDAGSILNTAAQASRPFGSSLPNELSQWVSDAADISRPEKRGQAWLSVWSRWKSLASFFASNGLHLYEYTPTGNMAVPSPAFPRSRNSASAAPPWARKAYDRSEDLEFDCLEMARTWPARDADGYEVLIRLASGPEPTDELRIFLRLNTAEARKDPRNHTLPVRKYLTCGKMIFVVLPRWDAVAYSPCVLSSTISELLDLMETFYEGLEFLHEMRIAHRHIQSSNMAMNVLVAPGEELEELRTPGSVHYAFVGLQSSTIFPEATVLSTLRVQRVTSRPLLGMGLQPGLCDPFKDDVLCLTTLSQTMVRVIEDVVPEVGLFFDAILHCSYDEVPSAAQALQKLRQLRTGVSNDQQRQPPSGILWKGSAGE